MAVRRKLVLLAISYCAILLMLYHQLLSIGEVTWRDEVITRKTNHWKKIGMVNMEDDEDVMKWISQGQVIHFTFEKVSPIMKWQDLGTSRSCPVIPMPDFEEYEDVDMIVVKLPCGEKDVFRLQVHLVAANLAVKRGKWDVLGKMDMVFVGKCSPMIDIFRCDDAVAEEGELKFYRPEKWRLEQKTELPVGPCALSMPVLWDRGLKVASKITGGEGTVTTKREAYATMLHSSENYICGAIVLAQTLIRTGTKRDLILLHDDSVSPDTLTALTRAGWKLRLITRIRYSKAKKGWHNEYNYSKLRLWELIQYDKIVYIDTDVVVLHNLDILFDFPQLSAAWDQGLTSDIIFNSGVMVIEPSMCTFRTMMSQTTKIISYNSGDQGFLNEFFVWWHQLPSGVNLLSLFWSGTVYGIRARSRLLGSVPHSIQYYNELFNNFWSNSSEVESDQPTVYSIHYSGWKPWRCYRDYNCNWDDADMRPFAEDEAHAWWWRVHDGMKDELKRFCGLTEQRKMELETMRNKARLLRYRDNHWRINITDPRQFQSNSGLEITL